VLSPPITSVGKSNLVISLNVEVRMVKIHSRHENWVLGRYAAEYGVKKAMKMFSANETRVRYHLKKVSSNFHTGALGKTRDLGKINILLCKHFLWQRCRFNPLTSLREYCDLVLSHLGISLSVTSIRRNVLFF